MSEQLTRSKRKAMSGPSQVDEAGEVAQAAEPRRRLRRKTQVVDSDEEADGGLLQAQWVSRGYVIPVTFPIEGFLRRDPDARWGIAELERLNAQYFFGPFRPIFPRLVRLFWQNMYKQDGSASLYTVVDGFRFEISQPVLSQILNCPTRPRDPIFHESVRQLRPHDIVATFSEGAPTGLGYLRRVDLPARLWFVDSVFKNIFPTSHKDERRVDFLRALYSVHLRVPIDIPGLVLAEMRKFHENSGPRTLMPFSTLVTDILTHPASLEAVQGGPPGPFEPPYDEDEDRTTRTMDQTTWRKSLRSLRKSRAIHAAGVPADEEGGDDADVEREAGAHDVPPGPPPFQPPALSAMLPKESRAIHTASVPADEEGGDGADVEMEAGAHDVPPGPPPFQPPPLADIPPKEPWTMSYAQYQDLVQRQNDCQASLDALRVMSEQVTRSKRQARGGPSQLHVPVQVAPVTEARAHTHRQRRQTQVVESDDEADDGLLQSQWASRGYVIPITFPIEEFLRHNPDAHWGIAELERINAQYFFGPFRPIFPRLVRLFWQNMYKQDGSTSLYTVVDGFHFKISQRILSQVLNCPTRHQEYIFHDSVRYLQPHEIVATFSEGVPTGLGYLRRVDLPARLWFVDSVFKNIFPTSHKDERRLDYLRALYSIHLGVPLDIPGLVLAEMKKFYENRGPRTLMPFATLVTDILNHPASLEAVQGGPPGPFEPPYDEEEDRTTRTMDQTTWRKSLRSLRKSRAIHAAGVPVDEEGGDDPDIERVAGANDVPPPFQPPPPATVPPQVPWTMSYGQYQDLVQRQNYCQVSLDALRAESHQNAYDFRVFFHALTGQPPLPPYQPPCYPPFPGARAPHSDDEA